MKSSKLNKGWTVIILISLLPVILWLFTAKINPPFSSLQNSLTSLGEIFGLVGIIIFSINIILTTRLFPINKIFNGLDDIYKKHAFLGQLAFILLLFHPLLLIPRYTSNLKEISSFLLISNSLARNYGIIALWGMIILIILTLYLKPKYKLWKITHKFFGIALFLSALHVYFIPGYIMNNLLLKAYVLFFAILGILAFLYRSIFSKYLIKKHIYIVNSLERLSNDIIEISLKPKTNHLKFSPGQFIFISFKQKGLSYESHPFSIISSPKEKILKISIKRLGDYTNDLYSKLKQGTIVNIEGPFGNFSYLDSENKNQIWIAGGIGITPFLSFIKDLKDKNTYHINIFYCVKNKEEAIYLNPIKEENEKNSQLNIIPFYSDQKNHLSAKYLKDNMVNFKYNDFFICAPPKMINELKAGLINLGINKNKIYLEDFNF